MTTPHPSPTAPESGSVLDGDPRVLIPLPEAAERLGISRWQAYKLARTGRWSAVPTARDPLLEAVDLRGAHDFRHTNATWLEDAGIPARVIDELMGHEATGRSGQQSGSAMGAHYRHTTPEMASRVVEATQQRLVIVLQLAEQTLETYPNSSAHLAL